MTVRVLDYATVQTRQASNTLQRSETALDVTPARSVAQRFGDVAQSLSRVGVAAVHAELLNSALQRLAELAYQTDTDGRRANVDIDGRLLVPVPMGKSGHKTWGLRRREGDTLRAILLTRQVAKAGAAVPLFVYDPAPRAWYVNLHDYPTQADAVAYVVRHGVTSREYKVTLESLQKVERRRT